MKVDFNQEIKNMDGTVALDETKDKDGNVTKSAPITLGTVCINALGSELTDPHTGRPVKPLDGKEKLHRFILGAKISDRQKKDGILDLPSDDVVLIKTLIADIYPPFMSGQSWLLLEPADDLPAESS